MLADRAMQCIRGAHAVRVILRPSLPLKGRCRPRQLKCSSEDRGSVQDQLAEEAKYYVTDVADIDRTAELLTLLFQAREANKNEAEDKGKHDKGPDVPTAVSTKSGSQPKAEDLEVATLGGGCFWCLDACFRNLNGVVKVTCGYAGGSGRDPSYNEVCKGTTGHAEVVQVTYNPSEISFEDLLNVFFSIHDPTTVNRQGNDIGTQYRSVVMYSTEEQKHEARAYIRDLVSSKAYEDAIVTLVMPLPEFFPAEDYHQDYFFQNPSQGYCRAVVAPKLRGFLDKFASKLKG